MNAQAPIVAVAMLVTKPGKQAEFEAALRTAIPKVHQESGCLLYALNHQAGCDDTYVMVEKWASKEDFRAHGNGDALADLNVALAGVMAAPPEVLVLAPIVVGDVELGML